jgi:hypothetical protein
LVLGDRHTEWKKPIWKEFLAARDTVDSVSWQMPFIGVKLIDRGFIRGTNPLENSELPIEEIDRLYESLPEQVFMQEILADFSERSSGLFRLIGDAATAKAQTERIDGHDYVV